MRSKPAHLNILDEVSVVVQHKVVQRATHVVQRVVPEGQPVPPRELETAVDGGLLQGAAKQLVARHVEAGGSNALTQLDGDVGGGAVTQQVLVLVVVEHLVVVLSRLVRAC